MKPKLLLIVPPDKNWDGVVTALNFPSLGAGYLASYLKNNGILVYGLDTSLDYSNMALDIKHKINEIKPNIVGVTVYSQLINEVKDIIGEVRRNTSSPIILGGPHISSTGTEYLKETGVEYGVRKDGERPLYNLISSLFIENNIENIKSIAGLMYKDGDDYISNLNIDDLSIDLDDIPFPDYSIFDLSQYPRWQDKYYTLLTSRGCPYSCTYCAAPLVTGKKFRKRSPENVLAEIEHYYNKGFRRFGFFDDVFNLDINRAKDIIRLIIKKGLNIKWDLSNGIRANTADLEFFQLLKKSGCNFVGIGMESGDDQVLKDIKKRLEKKKLLKVLEYANECGVGTAVNFIIGHPTETYESAINTLNFAESLPASYVNIYGLIPLKGTEAYSQLVEMEKSGNARFFMKFDEYVNSYTGQNSRSFYETDSFSIEQKNIILKKGRDLTNKKAMCFRFGKIFGAILFFISKNRYIYNIFSRIRSSQIGEKIYLSIRNE